jgi:hypothetical protein
VNHPSSQFPDAEEELCPLPAAGLPEAERDARSKQVSCVTFIVAVLVGFVMGGLALGVCIAYFFHPDGAPLWSFAIFYGPVYVGTVLLVPATGPGSDAMFIMALVVAICLYPGYAVILQLARARGFGRKAFLAMLVVHHSCYAIHYTRTGWTWLGRAEERLPASGPYVVLVLWGVYHVLGFWYSRHDAAGMSRFQFKLRDLLLVMLVLALTLGFACWRNSGP